MFVSDILDTRADLGKYIIIKYVNILNLNMDWNDLQIKTYNSCMKDLQYYLEPLYVSLLTFQYNVSQVLLLSVHNKAV